MAIGVMRNSWDRHFDSGIGSLRITY